MFVKKSTILYFVLLIFSLLHITLSSSTSIHILLLKRPSKKEVQFTPVPTTKSKFSQMCLSVSKTFNTIGKESLQIYKLCDGKYNLLGRNSKKIQDECPFCFRGLDQFFCTNKIENRGNEGKNGGVSNSKCKNEKLTSLILTSLKGCLEVSCYSIVCYFVM